MMDSSIPRSGDSGTSTAWVIDTVSDTNAGQGLDMAIVGGSPVIGYFATMGREDGPCEEVRTGTEEPPTRVLWSAYIAERSGGSFTERELTEVLSLVSPQGMSLADVDGSLRVAMLAGGAYNMGLQALCAANDLGLYSADGTVDVLVENSNEVAYDAASDAGFVVGHWPALAVDASGDTVVFYRDTHFGGIQLDDERRADVEATFSTGGAAAVDMGRGGGRFSDALFDRSGNAYVTFVDDFEFDVTSRGVQVARSTDGGSSFEVTRVAADMTERGPSVFVDGDGDIGVAYYDSVRRELAVARLTDASVFDSWQIDYLSSGGYDEGQDPSVAVNDAGDIAVGYYRCARTSRGGGDCVSDDDALVVAHLAPGDTEWDYEVVEEGPGGGRCGTQPSAAFDDTGVLWIAYVCQDVAGSTVEDRVHVAERDPY